MDEYAEKFTLLVRQRKEIQKVLRQKRELKKLHQEAFGRGKKSERLFLLEKK